VPGRRGRPASETRLKPISGRALDAVLLDVPGGYEAKNRADAMNRGR